MALSRSWKKWSTAAWIAGDDALGVPGAVARDVLDGLLHAGDDADRDDRVEILGAPVLLGCRPGTRIARADLGIAAQFAAGGHQRVGDGLVVRGEAVAVDEQRLGRAAYAGAAHLGVQR